MTAEMMAMATGHVDVAELLNKAKPVSFEIFLFCIDGIGFRFGFNWSCT
jgi:hypothetical protein